MTSYVLLGTALLLALASPWIGRRIRRHQAEQDRRAAAEHYRKRLLAATDHAITTAVRAQLAEPVTDLRIRPPMRVTIGDVVARARDDFALEVPRDHAAEMLRRRLEFRGHARWPDLLTDAFDDEEDQSS
ncbi:hypothetical protein OOK58_59205 [Streptomyces sp. NBC_01728]|uniref:hypothetical protein n=1 Tax=unclassified Streptomyces TaxID=2593676 RepID=UPI002250DE8A|nr:MULTISPECIES: hypothetical protein [unclassified Streptomyces]MCX4462439.1 hypothetical protein [Streptomyces sp. NBC_01719]MCX4500869.1 hypothetical protein [Streptomyces sp. NBC_01728]